jgi:hypothetical protein
VEQLLHDDLGVGVVTHRIKEVDSSLTDTNITVTLSLGRVYGMCCMCIRVRMRVCVRV